jgi:hypothetical protein
LQLLVFFPFALLEVTLIMDAEDNWTPLFQPAIMLAAAVFLVLAHWHGSEAGWVQQSAAAPLLVHRIADGLEHLPRYWLAAIGLLVAAGASLGEVTLGQSVQKCAKGALAALGPTLAAYVWMYFASAGELTGGMAEGGALGIATLFSVLLAFIVAAAASMLATWMPIAIAAIAAAIIIHFVHRLLNGAPMPWHQQQGETEVDSLRLVYDLGSVAAVFMVLAAAYDFIPGFSVLHIGRSEPTTVEAIWQELPKGDPDKLWVSTSKGRKKMESRVLGMRQKAEQTREDRCNFDRKTSLVGEVNSYFKQVRKYENWAPGKPLSSYSMQALNITVSALENNLLGWDDLKPHTRMHLDAVKYSVINYSYPLSCP